MTTRNVAIGGLVLFAALIILLVWANRSASDPLPPTSYYADVHSAQAVIPFRLHALTAVPAGFRLGGVVVSRSLSIPLVDIWYTAPRGGLITLDESSVDFRPVRGETTPVDINGAAGLAISTHNADGTSVGVVYWRSGGVTISLSSVPANGPSLVPLARSIE